MLTQAPATMSSPVLVSPRTSVRPAAGALVERPRLVRTLMEAHDVPLVVVSAPAGYGKTTALLEWAAHDPRPFAWVALRPEDDDPRSLVAAIARATRGRPGRDEGRGGVLVIDDVHHLRSGEAIGALEAIAERRPLGAQVVLASRREPPLRLGRLRGHRALVELTARDSS